MRNKIAKQTSWIVEVQYKSVVTDPAEESIKKGILDIGIKKVKEVKTAQKYIIKGVLDKEDIEKISKELLANTVVQTYKISKLKNSA